MTLGADGRTAVGGHVGRPPSGGGFGARTW